MTCSISSADSKCNTPHCFSPKRLKGDIGFKYYLILPFFTMKSENLLEWRAVIRWVKSISSKNWPEKTIHPLAGNRFLFSVNLK